jgi:hypothetical protein
MPDVIVQKWEESERGWGNKPHGYSIHKTTEDRTAFIAEYWDQMPDEVPDRYSRPYGTPYRAEVDEETFARIEGNGLRVLDDKYPGNGGKDGWVRMKGGGQGRRTSPW